jgi:hypothetical protein
MAEVAFAETQQLIRQQFDADYVVNALRRQAVRGAKEAVRRLPDLPGAIMRWVEALQRGGFTLYIDAESISKQIHELDTAISRNVRWLVLSLLLVGLMIGSAIASAVQTPGFAYLQPAANLIFVGGAGVASVIVLNMVWRWINRGEF